MATIFQFDDAKLAILQQEIPSNLQILRLRLRFELPVKLTIGQRFRISLELADEMGRSATIPQELLRQLEVHISHETGSSERTGIELKTKQIAINTVKTSSCTWSFDAEFNLKTKETNQSHEEPVEAAFHRAFQQFCLRSTWIDAETLVLPLQSSGIRMQLSSSPPRDSVQDQARKATQQDLSTSNLCSRMFSIDHPLTASKSPSESPAQRKVIAIQENYGDTMGSHIWDASILLSFALSKASQVPHGHEVHQNQGPHVMLELGAGCGLLAAVCSTLCESSSSSSEAHDTVKRMILTERAESLALLPSNLRLNTQRSDAGSGKAQPEIHFLPLMWGTPIDPKENLPRVDTIFAADVLYNWSAHEALLRTIDEIIRHRRCGSESGDSSASVVIAHKHRGEQQLRPFRSRSFFKEETAAAKSVASQNQQGRMARLASGPTGASRERRDWGKWMHYCSHANLGLEHSVRHQVPIVDSKRGLK